MISNFILNIAAGKEKSLFLDKHENCFCVNVDTNYPTSTNDGIENQMKYLMSMFEYNQAYNPGNMYISYDAFRFMERFPFKFNFISCYRYLEHVPFNSVLYFIYLMSTSIEKGGIVEIIVPDYKKLATMIINEDVYADDFEKNNIIITTELVNEISCPHASVWTKDRLEYFFKYEGRFEVASIEENYLFDNRDIYLYGQFVKRG